VSGGPVNLKTLGPLIAAGLVATGVGAPVAAAVAAALPLIDVIAGMFAPKPDHCDWYIGALCVSDARPYGPEDPTWTSFASFVHDVAPVKTALGTGGPPMLEAAFPFYLSTIACELDAMNMQMGPVSVPNPVVMADPVKQFLKAYYLAWQANAEYVINGYKAANPYDLLKAAVAAWNNGHQSSSTYTFVPKNAPSSRSGDCQPADVTYVSLLLAGGIDGQRYAPITLNTGPQKIDFRKAMNTLVASGAIASLPPPRLFVTPAVHDAVVRAALGHVATQDALQDVAGAAKQGDPAAQATADQARTALLALRALSYWIDFYGGGA
jgi:hypothetical protein